MAAIKVINPKQMLGLHPEMDVENSVTCGELRCISEYCYDAVTTSECGQSAAKLTEMVRRFNEHNRNILKEMMVCSELHSDVESPAEMIGSIG